MSGQMSLFDFGKEKFTTNKRIRLIELFGGIGAQSKALENLGVGFERWRYVEWCYKSIASYKAMHFPEDHRDYSEGISVSDIKKFIAESGVSDDWNSPMGQKKAMALSEGKARMIFNDIKASHCLPDITKAHASDFAISHDGFCYVMTYSFPCQDLSIAGKKKGMAKGSGTRSGMLWEVERLLREMKESGKAPDALIMENVPQVTNDSVSWNDWLRFLESVGYTNKGGVLNAKDFGVPQNRERFFLVSVFGDFAISLPSLGVDERHCLMDFCEKKAERRFFMTAEQLKRIVSWGSGRGNRGTQIEILGSVNGHQSGNIYSSNGLALSLCSHTHGETNEACGFEQQEVVPLNAIDEKGKERHLQDRVYSAKGISPAINASPSFSPSFAFDKNEVIQIGNINKGKENFKTPQREGRIHQKEQALL